MELLNSRCDKSDLRQVPTEYYTGATSQRTTPDGAVAEVR